MKYKDMLKINQMIKVKNPEDEYNIGGVVDKITDEGVYVSNLNMPYCGTWTYKFLKFEELEIENNLPDFFGTMLDIGDEVGYIDSSKSYQWLRKGTVRGFKGKKIIIEDDKTIWNKDNLTRRESHRVVKTSI